MDIAFWAASADGSSWYRVTNPSSALSWRGHRVWASQVLPDSRKASAEVIVGSRVAKPGPSQIWRELKARGKRLVLDLDDNYLGIEPGNAAAYAEWKPGGELHHALIENIKLSDRIIVTTEYLGDVIRQATGHPDVRTVPNGLHASLLGWARDYEPEHLTIGWAGTADTIRSLPMVSRPLSRILDYKGPQGRPVLQLVGSGLEEAAQAGLRHPRINAVEWVDGNELYLGWVNRFDVWVAPYADTEYNRCKFPTKALEAAFLGIPLIASDTVPMREWVARHGSDCGILLAREPWEWSKHLKALVDSPELRRHLGEQARQVATAYTLQNLGETWEQALG